MFNFRQPISILLLTLFPALVLANSPVVFQRDSIRFLPAASVQVIEEGETEESEAPPTREAFDIKVEIRPQDALRLEWIHTLNKLGEDEGVMIVLNEAMQLPLMPLQVFTPVDVVVADARGLVSQLIPNVVLATLNEDIVANRPTRAFIYLRAGSIDAYGILPNDRIDHPYFTPQQKVLQ